MHLRQRVVNAVEQGMSVDEAAHAFGVRATTVNHYLEMARKGTLISSNARQGPPYKVDARARDLLEDDLRARPDVAHGAPEPAVARG